MENPKKIILVNPWIHDFAAYDLWLKPLGLLYVASHLENHGFKVQLIDCLDYNKTPKLYDCSKFHSQEITKPCHFGNIPRKYKRYGMPPEVFAQLLMAINDTSPDDPPVLIGVTSMMTYWHQGVAETIKYIKQVFADTPVVLGGIYATLCYEHALKNSGADYVIKGPGEEEMLKLANTIKCHSGPAPGVYTAAREGEPRQRRERSECVIPAKAGIQQSPRMLSGSKNTAVTPDKYCPPLGRPAGFAWRGEDFASASRDRREANPVILDSRLHGNDRKESLYPSYHLYNNPQSAPMSHQDGNTERPEPEGHRGVAMLTSKGCPFRCSYCSSATLASSFTQRPLDELIDEIEYYQKNLGVTDIAFYDDALLVNAESHIHPILDGIIQRGLSKKLRFHTPNGLHIRYIDKLLAQKLYQANFKTIRLGFESMDEHKASPEQLAAVIAYLKEAGFTAENIGVYVLMGLLGQTMDEVDRVIEFVHKCGARVRISQYSPVPGSADFLKLLPDYPELAIEPLLHNKSVYYCHQKSGHFNDFEALKIKTLKLNSLLS